MKNCRKLATNYSVPFDFLGLAQRVRGNTALSSLLLQSGQALSPRECSVDTLVSLSSTTDDLLPETSPLKWFRQCKREQKTSIKRKNLISTDKSSELANAEILQVEVEEDNPIIKRRKLSLSNCLNMRVGSTSVSMSNQDLSTMIHAFVKQNPDKLKARISSVVRLNRCRLKGRYAVRQTNGFQPPLGSEFDEPTDSYGAVAGSGSETEEESIRDISTFVEVQGDRYYLPSDPTAIKLEEDDDFDVPPLKFGNLEFRPGSEDGSDSVQDGFKRPTLPSRHLRRRDDCPVRRWHRTWATIVKRDVPKQYRKLQYGWNIQNQLCKKAATLAMREIRKRAARSIRGSRDASLRARKLVREMQIRWRRYEKELAEIRKRDQKAEEERRKQEEEIREAKRQTKKLEFLLSQTELYSFFIAKNVSMAENQVLEENAPQEKNNADLNGSMMDNVPAPSPSPDIVEEDVTDAEESAGVFANGPPVSTLLSSEDIQAIRDEAREASEDYIKKQRERAANFDNELKKAKSVHSSTYIVASTPRTALSSLPSQQSFDAQSKDDYDKPSTMPEKMYISKEPRIFVGKLKSYQMKGLNWLVNLYEQGINGILADEMGLGKTIQSISFLAHLAENKDIWGPFLVVAPYSTLHNWEQEIKTFCPCLKVLPYWGSQQERRVIRQFWSSKQLHEKNSAFHVAVTSYHVFVNDEKHFHKVRWQHMILDEAQAIKNASSARWKTLLSLKCRNRLLLTGTPIQNSMAELWALLHFIMPSLFDNHDEFNDWFSKDIESHAMGDKAALDQHKLHRLHLILKPFMLRRVKRDVEHEMPAKIEVEIKCELSLRQQKLYRALKEKISLRDLIKIRDKDNANLMNLVMQFRKVCNHPEIFQRRDVSSPFHFSCHQPTTFPPGQQPFIAPSHCNPIVFTCPTTIYHSLHPAFDSLAGVRLKLLKNTFSIWHPEYIHHSLFPRDIKHLSRQSSVTSSGNQTHVSSAFSFLRFIDYSAAEAAVVFMSDILMRWYIHLFFIHRHNQLVQPVLSRILSRKQHISLSHTSASISMTLSLNARVLDSAPIDSRARLLILASNLWPPLVSSVPSSVLPPLVTRNIAALMQDCQHLINVTQIYAPACTAPPIQMLVSSKHAVASAEACFWNPWELSVLNGFNCAVFRDSNNFPPLHLPSSLSEHVVQPRAFCTNKYDTALVFDGLCAKANDMFGNRQVVIPDFGKLLGDSGKLQILDSLLRRLKAEGHRVLIFCQMTKMIDILEDYMRYRQHKYFRLDGQTDISDRRDMVRDFQLGTECFVFILSTRAGGLGINLTAADTVIFYDNDWNPTMDAQAMDRVHRIGQTKQVTVYRMVCRNTVEERILQRAQEKYNIQKTVYSGGFKLQTTGTTDSFKTNELVSFLMDDETNSKQKPLKF